VRRLCILALLSLASCACADPPDGSILLWQQEPDLDNPNGFASQDARNDGGLGWFAEVADDFYCEDGQVVGHIAFWGLFFNPQDQHGNIEGFMISFYDYDPGPPSKPANWSNPLYRQDLPFQETMIGNYAGWDVYQYNVNLDPNFYQEPGEYYFVSVVAILARGGNADEPQWGWMSTHDIWNDSAVQWFFDPGNFSPLGNDMAFEFYWVPEPGLVSFAGLLVGIGVIWLRRK
jgi:hypothetical protein